MTIDGAEIIWEIDRFGRISVEKADETGSLKIWLGPTEEVLSGLADFLSRTNVTPAPCSGRFAFKREMVGCGGWIYSVPAQGIEAPSGGETPEIGSTEGESPVPKECARKGSK